MNLPSGLVFFLDFQYGDPTGKAAPSGPFGPGSDPYGATSSMYGNTNPGRSTDASQGLYGAGRFAYTINQFSSSVTMSATAANWQDLQYSAELSSSVASFTRVTVSGIGAGTSVPRPDFKGVRAFTIASGSATAPQSTIVYFHNLPQQMVLLQLHLSFQDQVL
jgi:hypothetical protein